MHPTPVIILGGGEWDWMRLGHGFSVHIFHLSLGPSDFQHLFIGTNVGEP
jgi:hypothetical protein